MQCSKPRAFLAQSNALPRVPATAVSQPTSFPKSDIRVLLLEGVSATAVESFRAAGYSQVRTFEKALPVEQLHRELADAHLVGIRSRTQLDAEALSHARRVIAIR